MTEMFGEAWSPMAVPDLAPDDDDDDSFPGYLVHAKHCNCLRIFIVYTFYFRCYIIN